MGAWDIPCVSMDCLDAAAGRNRRDRHGVQTDVVVARTRGALEAKMFSSSGIPEILTGVIVGIAAIGFYLFWRGGGRRIL
jgi:hypothetical protein